MGSDVMKDQESGALKSMGAERSKILHEIKLTHEVLEEQNSRLEKLTREVMACKNQLSATPSAMQTRRAGTDTVPSQSAVERQRQVIFEIRLLLASFIRELKSSDNGEQYQPQLALLDSYLEELELDSADHIDRSDCLSLRELRVSSMIRIGMTTEQIAERLHISPDTVKTHRRNIRRKLHIVGKRNDLASYLRSSHGQEGSAGKVNEGSKRSGENDRNSLKSESPNGRARRATARESSRTENTFDLIAGWLADGT